MGSPIDSSRPAIRDSTSGGGAPLHPLLIQPRDAHLTGTYALEELLVTAFMRPEGCFRKDIQEFLPAVPDEHGDYQVPIAQEYLQRPPAPQVPMPNAVDALYAAEFRRIDRMRLELGLEASIMVGRPQVPPSVTEGSVSILSVVGMATGGEAVFGSVLEEHVPIGHAK